jgi:hypothetical protein
VRRFISDAKIHKLVSDVSSIFKSKKLFLSQDRHIIFLCGGPVKRPQSSSRSKFCHYARTSLKNVTFFLAEDASRDFIKHGDPEFINLSEFEKFIAGVANGVILFPETHGAIAELGLFSGHVEIRKKLLVVNDRQHQGQDSFINLGPMDTVDKYSLFKPRLVLDLGVPKPNFSDVTDRLERLGQFRNRKVFRTDRFKDMPPNERLFVVLELVNLFGALSFAEIAEVVTYIFGKPKARELRHLLSVLIAANYLRRKGPDEEVFSPANPPHSFFDFEGFDYDGLKVEIVDYYQTYDPDRVDLLKA